MSTVINYFFDSFLTISVVILIVLVVRGLLFRKLPRRFAYLLWAVVGLRLLCPISLPAPVSIFNLPAFEKANDAISPHFKSTVADESSKNVNSAEANPHSTDFFGEYEGTNTNSADGNGESKRTNTDSADGNGESKGNNTLSADSPTQRGSSIDANPQTSGSTGEKSGKSPVSADFLKFPVLFFLWMAGVCFFLGKNILAALRLHKGLATAVLFKDNIYESDRISTPFVKGIVRPKIYIPFRLSDIEQRYILAHEQYHIKRFDPFFKLLATLLLGIYWFNPLVWLAYRLFVQDMEMSCDEYVLATEGADIRKVYSSLLLSFAVDKSVSRSALCFGEHNTRLRISHILKYKKAGLPATVIALLLILLVSGCTLTGGISASGDGKNTAETWEDYSGPWLEIKERKTAIEEPVFTEPNLLYADAGKIIFTVNGGLFAWDKEKWCMTDNLDLQSIDCEDLCGDRKTEIVATKKGNAVWIHRKGDKHFYIYNTEFHGLLQQDYTKDSFKKIKKCESFIDPARHGIKGIQFTDKSGQEISSYLMVQGRGNQLGQLCYCDTSTGEENLFTKPLFLDVTGLKYGKATDLTPGELKDLEMVSFFQEGSMIKYEIDDPKIMKAFTECINNSKPMKGRSGCPFDTPLYLTLGDGTIKVIYPAWDGCPCFIANGIEYEVPQKGHFGDILGNGTDIFLDTLIFIKKDVGISSSDQWGLFLNAASDEYQGKLHYVFHPEAKIYVPDTYGYKEISRKEFSDYLKEDGRKNSLNGFTIYCEGKSKTCIRVVINSET